MIYLHCVFGLGIMRVLAITLLGFSLPQWLLAQEAVNRPFAPLELRPPELIEMVRIPAGRFTMGSDKNNDERPAHTVFIQSFLMGKTEVTQRQWADVMGSNPSQYAACGPDCPVDNVSWVDAQTFISRLNQKTGKAYRLPSESEWEYAARAGSTTEWSFGNDESILRDYAWHTGSYGAKSHAVGQKLPNAFGLYDMHGNVWEWTQDCWHDTYSGAPADGIAWTTSCTGNYRVLRGGSWVNGPALLRSAKRSGDNPGNRNGSLGLRLARTLVTP